jgi:hypothetical protein
VLGSYSSVSANDPLLALAELVAAEAAAVGVQTAIIGGIAVSMYGAPRATLDIDLGAAAAIGSLAALGDRLKERGLKFRLRTPDSDDELNGVLDVWESEIEDEDGEMVPDGLVQVINFKDAIGARAVRNARDADGLRLIRLEDLILLKLNANGVIDRLDVKLLLETGQVDVAELRNVCRQHGLEDRLVNLLD